MHKTFYLITLMLAVTPMRLFAEEIPVELSALPGDVRQAVVVETTGEAAARVSGWEREETVWRQVIEPVAAVIGKNGLAPSGEKREGDGRTPSGVFALRRAFGYDQGVQTELDYRAVTEKDFWIDASASPFYNQWITGDVPEISHELLRRQDELYKYAIVIEYNTDPVIPGMGSAIFMHVWRGAGQPTAGCVAVAQAELLRLLQWLDGRQNPVIL